MNPITLDRDFTLISAGGSSNCILQNNVRPTDGYHYHYILPIRRRYASDLTRNTSFKLGGPIRPFRQITNSLARFAHIKFGVDVLWQNS